jgi:MSHA pilin protein MshC
MMEILQKERMRSKSDRGFTLIEIIAVLVILGIISAVAISRGISTDTVSLTAEENTLKGHLRYAQYLALNDIPPAKWGINLQGSSYTLVKNESGNGTTFTTPVSLPAESSATHSFSPITATPSTVLFDEWGSPTINGDPNVSSIFFGGKTITITTNTGFIP